MFNQMPNHECLMLFEFPHVTEVMAVMIQYLQEVLTLLKRAENQARYSSI